METNAKEQCTVDCAETTVICLQKKKILVKFIRQYCAHTGF